MLKGLAVCDGVVLCHSSVSCRAAECACTGSSRICGRERVPAEGCGCACTNYALVLTIVGLSQAHAWLHAACALRRCMWHGVLRHDAEGQCVLRKWSVGSLVMAAWVPCTDGTCQHTFGGCFTSHMRVGVQVATCGTRAPAAPTNLVTLCVRVCSVLVARWTTCLMGCPLALLLLLLCWCRLLAMNVRGCCPDLPAGARAAPKVPLPATAAATAAALGWRGVLVLMCCCSLGCLSLCGP